ncbi:amino acid ABC transporter substrate-binding protein [Croceicoccus mobilis]|uniref:Amino acid ABC transporter substrate-binding protein n=1 Tax=Croceicoccus mobilis TaxID=1703339 RepID=A0A916Z063_9SPHN|nr:amino acid ABC transporter substrate-binding protein [Croceicoccus mobilis]
MLRVGLYQKNRPWSWEEDGQVMGIDADIARACADALGVKTDLALFPADEEVSDDLRNVVWRGGLLGFRRCDVMMHVPFDRQFAAQETEVVILAPYYRESFTAACANDAATDCEGVPTQFRGKRLAAEIDSIPDFYLVGSFGGILRPDVGHYTTGYEAVSALGEGKADIAVATRAQVESAMAGNKANGGADIVPRQGPLPAMLSPGWDIGIAVREDSRSLGFRLEDLIHGMAESGQLKDIFARHGVEWRNALALQPNT